MNLGIHEQICLNFLRMHEGDSGLDMNELVSGIGREYLSMDAEQIMNAIYSLYRGGVIERRYDGRYEIPEF